MANPLVSGYLQPGNKETKQQIRDECRTHAHEKGGGGSMANPLVSGIPAAKVLYLNPVHASLRSGDGCRLEQ